MNTSLKPKQDEGFVYGLVDPDTNELRYIGVTTTYPSRRKGNHMKEARSSKRVNHRLNWLRKLDEENKEPKVEILARTHKSYLFDMEIEFIKNARAVGHNLVNNNDGGTGQLNPDKHVRWKIGTANRGRSDELWTEERREKHSERLKGNNYSQGVAEKYWNERRFAAVVGKLCNESPKSLAEYVGLQKGFWKHHANNKLNLQGQKTGLGAAIKLVGEPQ